MSSGQREACEWAPGEAPIPHKQVQGLVALWEKDKKEPGKELEPASWEGGLQPQLPSEPPLPHPPSVPQGGGGPGNCQHHEPGASVLGWCLARGDGDGTHCREGPGQGEKPRPTQKQRPTPTAPPQCRGQGEMGSCTLKPGEPQGLLLCGYVGVGFGAGDLFFVLCFVLL